MASTNKTTNYELSQYIGTDKPTYLGDYNSDMGKIDTALHTNATAISGVGGDISVIEGNIGTMANLETTDKSSLVNAVNEVNTNTSTNSTNIGSLSNLDTTNKTTIVNAINEVVSKLTPFKFEQQTETINLTQNNWTSKSITFNNTFTNIYQVLVTVKKGANENAKRCYSPLVSNITTTGCDILVYNVDTGGNEDFEIFVIGD